METTEKAKLRQKRLVGKGEYFRLRGKKIALYAAISLPLTAGLLFWSILFVPGMPPISQARPGFLFVFGLPVALSSMFFRLCIKTFREARAVESVELITVRNRHLLPPEEILGRASDVPPSQQPTELLRASGAFRAETPPEELLRASRTHGQEGR